MPLDKYLPAINLKIDQVIALSQGHVRYESGVTKYYAPNMHMVFSWETPETFNRQRDFYNLNYSYYNSAVSPIGYLSGFPYYGDAQYIDGRLPKRISLPQIDINGAYSGNGDNFVTTAGSLGSIGFRVRTRDQQFTSDGQPDASYTVRNSSATVYSMFFFTSGLRALSTGVTISSVASSGNFPYTSGYFAAAPSTLTYSATQNTANALVITVPFRSAASSSNAPGILLPWSQTTGPDENIVPTNVYRVSVLSGGVDVASTFLTTSNIVTAGSGGFVGSIPASSIPNTRSYTVRVEEKVPALYASVPSGYVLDTYAVCCQGVSTVSVSSTMTLTGLDTAVVTGGGAVTGGGTASVSTVTLSTAVSALAADWIIQDLQINLRTRAVQSSLTTIKIKPNDTAILGLLFHDGTYVVDPGLTNLKFAARDSSNAGAYTIYDTDTTVVSVGDANYYQIEVLANDSDLLDTQNSNLLAGSNASQSLLGEIQWTTTRGTFSSDTFTINVPSEVVREPDV
jgi:hypothetical protein